MSSKIKYGCPPAPMMDHGWRVWSPPIRSSDYRSLRSCPLTWLISRRYAMVPRLRYSEALSRGSWFHLHLSAHALNAVDNSLPPAELVQNILHSRMDELRLACRALNISGDSMLRILEREEHDANTTSAWFNAASTAPFGEWSSFMSLLQPPWRVLAVEPLIHHGGSLAQPDLILHHEATNGIWIVDAKTTSDSALARASVCAHEFQTQHYFATVAGHMRRAFEDRLDEPMFTLPEGATLRGVLHLVVEKPSINFGQPDRPYTLDTSPLKSGPRKGEPRNEKVYEGEPKLSLYEARCRDWYRGEGDYTHLKEQRTGPTVNISWTTAGILTSDSLAWEYSSRVDFIRGYADREPHPCNYEMGDPVPSSFAPNPYLPFLLSDPVMWPEVAVGEGFIQAPRPGDGDPDVTD